MSPDSEPLKELLLLNSRRLTAARVRRLTLALKIPTVGIAVDVRQLLDVKLMERGHEPMKVLAEQSPLQPAHATVPVPVSLYQCLTLCQALTDVSLLPTA